MLSVSCTIKTFKRKLRACISYAHHRNDEPDTQRYQANCQRLYGYWVQEPESNTGSPNQWC